MALLPVRSGCHFETGGRFRSRSAASCANSESGSVTETTVTATGSVVQPDARFARNTSRSIRIMCVAPRRYSASASIEGDAVQPPMNFITVTSPWNETVCLSAKRFHEQPLQTRQREMFRPLEQIADVVAVRARQAAVQESVRRQPQPRAGAAEGLGFVRDDAEHTVARNFVANRRRVVRGVGSREVVARADHLQQLRLPDELTRVVGAVLQMTHVHQFDETQFDAAFEAEVEQRQSPGRGSHAASAPC